MSRLSWKPVRRGKTFCAPACGNGCTLVEYRRAKSRAAALRARMGKNWTVNIHENLGWHWNLDLITEAKGARGETMILKLYEDRYDGKTTYHCMFGEGVAGDLDFYETKHFDEPEKAVARSLSLVRSYVRRRTAQLQALETALRNFSMIGV